MTGHRQSKDYKQDRALKLSDKGLTSAQIAERLGSSQANVCQMIRIARLRRDKANIAVKTILQHTAETAEKVGA